MKISILGDGAWGNALSSVLKSNNHEVKLFGRNQPIENPEILLISVPSQNIREALKNVYITKHLPKIINASKGIDPKTSLLPYQIINSHFGKKIEYYSLIGPSFANEVINKMPTVVNLGYEKNKAKALKIRNLFKTDFFDVKLTTCIKQIELFAVFKNIYAIGCGLSDGLGFGINTRVHLIILALEEMNKLTKALKIKSNETSFPGTLGDLILTCNSIESRNYRFGKLLATTRVEDSISQINSTIEGYQGINHIKYFEKISGVKLTLASFVKEIISDNNAKTVKIKFEHFITT